MPKRLILEINTMDLIPMRPNDHVCSFGEGTDSPAVALNIGDGQCVVVSFADDQTPAEYTGKDPDDILHEFGEYLQELSGNLRGSAVIADYAEEILRKVNELWEVPHKDTPKPGWLHLDSVEKGLLRVALSNYSCHLADCGNSDLAKSRVDNILKVLEDI